jgi:hypothetical protein
VPQDLFGTVLQGVRERGVKVEAYTTVCWDEDSARKHSDWVMLNGDRQPIRMNDGKTFAKWTWLCINSHYRDYFLRQMDELISNYDFEGLFLDIVFNHRALVCYNPYCQAKWKALYGSDMPYPMNDRDYARYLDFNAATFEELFEQVRQIGARRSKQFLMTHNFGLTYKADDYVASEFDTHGADFYLPSIRAKLFRARAKGKEVELIGHRFNRQWDFTLKPLALMQFEVATAVGHNCAMMYVDQPYLDGSLDPQVYAALKNAFKTADDLIPKVRATQPYAEIGLLSSERSFEFDYDSYRDFAGAYAMLTQLHLPFDVLTETGLGELRPEQTRVLVIPNVVHMDPSSCSALESYMQQGGHIVFCYRTATKDRIGDTLQRSSLGVVKLQNDSENQVSFVRPRKWKLSNRYLRTSSAVIFEPAGPHDVIGNITNPALRITDVEWITHNVMPGEETTLPAIIAGRQGKGGYVYFGFRLFDDFVQQGQPALLDAFDESLKSFYRPTIWVEAPGNVEAVYNRRDDRILITLINGITSKVMTGDMWAGERGARGSVSIPETVPVHDITIKSAGLPISTAMDLNGKTLQVTKNGNDISVSLPRLDQYGLVELVLG